MYKNIKRLYEQGKISESGVKAALERGWITEAQHDEILGINQEPEIEEEIEEGLEIDPEAEVKEDDTENEQ